MILKKKQRFSTVISFSTFDEPPKLGYYDKEKIVIDEKINRITIFPESISNANSLLDGLYDNYNVKNFFIRALFRTDVTNNMDISFESWLFTGKDYYFDSQTYGPYFQYQYMNNAYYYADDI